MLRLEKVGISYGNNEVISDISMSVNKGDFITIIGVNGCGKSTLLKAIARNIRPQMGDVIIDGKLVYKALSKEIAKLLAFLPQNPQTPKDFTVRELVSFGRFPHHRFISRLTKEDIDTVDWAIKMTNLRDMQERTVSTLSGGERQRAWIAMALAQKTDYLLLDEPTTFLDIAHQYELLELVSYLNRTLGITILMVLHDINQAVRYSNQIIILKDKHIFRRGRPEEVVNVDTLREVYGIKVKKVMDSTINKPHFITIGKDERL